MESLQQQKMKSLWKSTFHDSDEYINLIFDNYYNPNLTACRYVSEDLVAALMGIPYLFKDKGSDKSIKGLYLCGLATKPEYRAKGIMTELLEEITRKATSEGFSFMFLIPADEGLRLYYGNRGFVDNFFYEVQNYSSIHNFNSAPNIKTGSLENITEETESENENNSISLSCDLAYRKTTKMDAEELCNIDRVLSFLLSVERSRYCVNILHTNTDWNCILKDVLMSKMNIRYLQTKDGDVVGFSILENEYNGNIEVKFIVAENDEYQENLLSNIKREFFDETMSVLNYYPQISMVGISSSYVPGVNEVGSDRFDDHHEEVVDTTRMLKSFGMVKILSFSEILKFVSNGENGLKYSILVKDEDDGDLLEIRYENGIFKEERISALGYSLREDILSKRELASLICRVPSMHDYVKEAFRLPCFNPVAYLMLE